MSRVQVPSGAIGRVGQIAQLRRVTPGHEGRLVAVHRPIGPMSSLGAGPRPVFAWQVVVLGDPIQLNGRACREIVVADRCLVPVSQVEPAQVEALADRSFQQDLDEARAEVTRLLAALNLSTSEWAAMQGPAVHGPAIDRLLEVAPVPVVLAEMDFRPTRREAGDAGPWQWSGVHGGVELHVIAGTDLFGRWTLAGRCITTRELMWDERVLADTEPRGRVGLLVLGLWRAAFGGNAPVPANLHFALDFERHVRDMRGLEIGLPTLRADGQVLRAVRRWIAERHGLAPGECGPPADRPMSLIHGDGLLRIEVGDTVLGCPAQGAWVSDCQVSLQAFLAMPHWHLRGATVPLVQSVDALEIGRCGLAASGWAGAASG